MLISLFYSRHPRKTAQRTRPAHLGPTATDEGAPRKARLPAEESQEEPGDDNHRAAAISHGHAVTSAGLLLDAIVLTPPSWSPRWIHPHISSSYHPSKHLTRSFFFFFFSGLRPAPIFLFYFPITLLPLLLLNANFRPCPAFAWDMLHFSSAPRFAYSSLSLLFDLVSFSHAISNMRRRSLQAQSCIRCSMFHAIIRPLGLVVSMLPFRFLSFASIFSPCSYSIASSCLIPIPPSSHTVWRKHQKISP